MKIPIQGPQALVSELTLIKKKFLKGVRESSTKVISSKKPSHI